MARGFLLKKPYNSDIAELLSRVGQDRGAGFFVKKPYNSDICRIIITCWTGPWRGLFYKKNLPILITTSAELLLGVGQDRGAGFYKKTLQF